MRTDDCPMVGVDATGANRISFCAQSFNLAGFGSNVLGDTAALA